MKLTVRVLKELISEQIRLVLNEAGSYQGEHQAPTKEDGAPMHNLTGIYPDDFYSLNAVRLYSSGEPYDAETIHLIQTVKNKPKMAIKVYRAVPLIQSTEEQIAELEDQKRQIMKRGKIPSGVKTSLSPSGYYNQISDKIDTLKNSPTVPAPRMSINPGDWVAVNKKYAVEHGKSNLNGRYRIVTKTVPARTLFTDGNSIQEWGYDPS